MVEKMAVGGWKIKKIWKEGEKSLYPKWTSEVSSWQYLAEHCHETKS